MRHVLAGIFTLISIFSFAQQEEYVKPDFESIQRMVGDHNSAFYYPDLLRSYAGNDTTLSLRDYRYLYYGYVFQKDYVPEPKNPFLPEVEAILTKSSRTEADWKQLIGLEKRFLETAPFNMRDLHLMYLAYTELGQPEIASAYRDKIVKIARTILSSGDGKTEATALTVISISHEYDLIGVLGLDYSGKEKILHEQFDYLSLADNQYNLKGIYFDLGSLFDKIEQN